MKKKKIKKKIIYHDPPMRYNIALHKFEVNLPSLKNEIPEEEIKISGTKFAISIIVILFILYLIVKLSRLLVRI